MFPLPMRMMMKFKPASPIVQRAMSWMMSWMMDNQDGKVRAGQVLKEINQVNLIIHPVFVSISFQNAAVRPK